MRYLILSLAFCLFSQLSLYGERGNLLEKYLTPQATKRGQIYRVQPPEEIKKYVKKVKEATRKDQEWFKKYLKKTNPDEPLPYHEKLGLTKKEYDEYLALWAQRKSVVLPNGELTLKLEKREKDLWKIKVTGIASVITTLNYDPKKNVFISPNGELKPLDHIDSGEKTLLGAWTGHEWLYTTEDDYVSTQENIAIGKMKKGKYGLLIYRFKEVSKLGSVLADTTFIIRFPAR